MLSFAALLLAVGLVMLHGGGHGVRRGTCRTLRCISVGATVGVLTGFLGVGGGFLIVPALVVFAGLETKMAVGTSLAIIALNSAAGLAGQLRYAAVDWPLTITFIGLTLAGMLAGLSMSQRISEDASRKGFAVFLLIVSVAVAGTNI
jgi:uncharacterized membrane protein YfcA